MPLFGDLAKLFQQQAPATWDAARQLAISVATDGQSEPNIDPVDRMNLEQLARVAELRVADVTGLTTAIGGGLTVTAVTRAVWAQRTLDAYRPLLEHLSESLEPTIQLPGEDEDLPGGDQTMAWLGNMMQMLGPMMLGMTAGSMVGHLAQRALGGDKTLRSRPNSVV